MKLAITFVVVAAAAMPVAAQEEALQEAWKELFKQPAPPKAAKQISAVLAACGGNVETLKRLIASDTAYRQCKAGWHRQTTKVADGQKSYDVEFFIRIPRGYKAAESRPLLLAAHGQGGSGKHIGAIMQMLLGRDLEKYIILAPTMPGPKHYNGRQYQEQAYLKPLAWARRNLNIDDDRIYVSGYSQGGHCTWHLATLFPHLFAAAVPMAGSPIFQGGDTTFTIYLENLSNLPMWAIWGEKDTADPPMLGNVDICRAAARRLEALDNKMFKPTELPGAGHGDCVPDPDKFAKYLASHKRGGPPAKLAHFFHLARHSRGYYLQAVELAHDPIDFTNVKITVTRRPGHELNKSEIRELMRKHVAKYLFKMWGELDRAKNSLSIRAVAIRRVRLYVTAGMFDLSRPVTIRYWSRTWRGRIAVSPRCVLSHYAAGRDATAMVCNEIDFDITGKAAVRFKNR